MSIAAVNQAGRTRFFGGRSSGFVVNLVSVGGATVLIRLLNLVILSYAGRKRLGRRVSAKWGLRLP